MDEDDITTPTYSIPQLGSGVVGFGGTTFNRFTWPDEFVGPGGTSELLHEERQRHIHEQAEAIRNRLLERFPNLEFLKTRDYEIVHQYRPAAARIIVKVHDAGDYSGLLVVHVNGLGGSGFTIAPAVVQDALALPIEETVNDRELDLMDE
jgi:glycine/D-amino acid oxidase-like deaminating enzyme